jgi:hypothetical protein
MSNPLIATFKYSRKKLLDMYGDFAKKTGSEFLVTTKPVHSVQSLQGDVVNANAAQVLGAYAYLVFRRGQQMVFFEPALGQSAPLSGDPNHRFSEADTTLTKPRSTPGAADMAIEGLGFEVRGTKPVYAAATDFFPAGQTLDPTVAAALNGTGAIYDPGSKIIPAEFSSPAMLEQTLMSALSPYLALSFEWDQAERTEKIGTANQLGVGGGSSFLHANGVPSSQDRYEIPEGYIWSRDGEPGSEFVCRATLTENVVVPFTPVSHLEAATFVAPTHIHTEFMLRAFGIQLRMPNKN